jgi:hypothetical protein
MLLIFLSNFGMGGSDSTVPIITPDCYLAADGAITDSPSSDIAANGAIVGFIAANGAIDATDIAAAGAIRDTNAADGDLCQN